MYLFKNILFLNIGRVKLEQFENASCHVIVCGLTFPSYILLAYC